MKSFIKSVHVFGLIFGGFSCLAVLATLLTLVRFLAAPEQLENRPPGTMIGVVVTSVIFAGTAFAGLGAFFARKSLRGRTLGLVFGAILCLNIFWVPFTLLPGYKLLSVFPILLALVGLWSVLVMSHPDTPAAIQANTRTAGTESQSDAPEPGQ